MRYSFSLEELPKAAEKFIDEIQDNRIFAFDGSMGAGKTTFISAVCSMLGANDDFGSPTFSIVNEYVDGKGNPIYHFDFYRLKNPQEALDIGAEDYFNSGCLCLIEWPDKIEELLPDETVRVQITENEDGTRLITTDNEVYKAR